MNEYKTYNLKEVEKILGKTRVTLLAWIKDGRLPAVKVGRTWRVSQETLNDILGVKEKPTIHNSGQLFINENGRLQLDNTELTSGDALDVLILDGLDKKVKWISTRVEAQDGEYYLVGLIGYSPVGLFARV